MDCDGPKHVIIHDLDEESPLKDFTVEMLSASTMLYILNVSGHDSSFNQTIYQYQRFQGEQLRADVVFKDMVHIDPVTGKTMISIEELHELIEVPGEVTDEDAHV